MRLHEAQILIVDDESALREIFTQWVEMAGCAMVREASNGEAALAAIQAQPVDILITDVRMPVMDGVTLVRRLYELGIDIPSIIFVSGFADVDVSQMYHLGVEAFLSKPFKREDLIGSIEKSLADRSTLWLVPMDPPPRQSMSVEVVNLASSRAAGEPAVGSLLIGRGGFSVHVAAPLALGKVAFTCRFAVDSLDAPNGRVLTGHGNVRWFSRTEQTVGIEFAYLEPGCRAWVLDEIRTADPHSFIPGS